MAGSGEESDGSVVPVKAAKAAGGKGPCSKRRPQQGRIGDCGDTKNSGKDPGTATGALPASQEGAELPSVRAVRQGLPKGRAGPRLRAGEDEAVPAWTGTARVHPEAERRGAAIGDSQHP